MGLWCNKYIPIPFTYRVQNMHNSNYMMSSALSGLVVLAYENTKTGKANMIYPSSFQGNTSTYIGPGNDEMIGINITIQPPIILICIQSLSSTVILTQEDTKFDVLFINYILSTPDVISECITCLYLWQLNLAWIYSKEHIKGRTMWKILTEDDTCYPRYIFCTEWAPGGVFCSYLMP